MKDRNVEFPNRYRMVKVEGTDDIVDLIPAPGDVYAEGTFRNKANDLSDATLALFNMGTNAVQNDVFAWLGQYNTHWWRVKDSSAKYVEYLEPLTTVSIMAVPNYSNSGGVVYYYDSVSFDDYGEYVLSGEKTVTVSYDTYTNASVLRGKYFFTTNNGTIYRDRLYYMPATASITRKNSSSGQAWYYVNGEAHLVSSRYADDTTAWRYLNSVNRDAYPDSGVVNGMEYQYLGIPFSNTIEVPKVAIGSYVGTGTIGPSTPNSITLTFAPKMLIIFDSNKQYDSSSSTKQGYLTVISSMSEVQWYGRYKSATSTNIQNGTVNVYFAFTGNTVSWYAPVTFPNNTSLYYQPDCQLNASGAEYKYIAIG